ncbi:lysophospholipase [Planococcus antarcticus DSM 14505]|uniref:Lysophospholipase n=1 Tax=Planococcus antarcticus DSM 14505 TaxID=1185653 RepID=A0AA87LNQ1_9BACL|nr:alpha/beta hydrolase [Planococcus antarcticus]EIM05278.1 lysophospholipase [Planococcus antarcticus DSM 14505]
MSKEKMIRSFDETQLFTRKDTAQKQKAAVVIAHGLAEHLGRYDALAKTLLEYGFTVYRYEQRGHARSEGKRAFFNDFNEMPDDLKTIMDWAKEENSGQSVFLIGHSMGGFSAAAYATKYPGTADGVILSGALTRYNKELFGPLPMDLPLDTYLDNELGEGVCSDPEVVKAYGEDPLVEKKISVGLINEFAPGIAWLKENAAPFVDPVLVLHGNEDGLVAEKDSRDFYSEIGSKDKTLKIYAFLMHEIFNEPSKYKIYDELVEWMDDRL